MAQRVANANEFSHYSDWRLPTSKEFRSIILCSQNTLRAEAVVGEDCRLRYLPSVLPNAFPAGRHYWSSTVAFIKSMAWVADLQQGGMEPRDLDAMAAVLLVRDVPEDEEYTLAVRSGDLASANSYLHHYPQGKHRETVFKAKRDFLIRNNSEVRAQGLILATIIKPQSDANQAVPIAPFAMSTTEVPFAVFDIYSKQKGLRDADDNQWGRAQRPVINITFDEALAFTQWLSDYTGEPYRLPTLAEWQYAAGTNHSEGKKTELNCTQANISPHQGQACSVGFKLPEGGTLPGGQYAHNEFGLWDMAGNVAEWLGDCAEQNSANSTCEARLIIGGAWLSHPEDATANSVQILHPHRKGAHIGFRVVKPL